MPYSNDKAAPMPEDMGEPSQYAKKPACNSHRWNIAWKVMVYTPSTRPHSSFGVTNCSKVLVRALLRQLGHRDSFTTFSVSPRLERFHV